LAEKLLHHYKNTIAGLTLLPSSGGGFEVTLDDHLIFSKAALGRHADPDEIVAAIERREPVTA
jgi:selenoprotein W-related protein